MKRKDLFGDKQTQYTIRKLSVGVASVATGVCIFLHSPQVFAEEVSASPANTAIAESNINQVDNQQSTNLKDDINSNSAKYSRQNFSSYRCSKPYLESS